MSTIGERLLKLVRNGSPIAVAGSFNASCDLPHITVGLHGKCCRIGDSMRPRQQRNCPLEIFEVRGILRNWQIALRPKDVFDVLLYDQMR